jgi:CheY-like chemotaxis protein
VEHPQALVLIVDDEHAVRRLAGELLTRAGFTVVTANDGEEAVAMVRRGGLEFDAVLLDMTMPHMSGSEACREIKELRPELPVVLTSGCRQDDAVPLFEEGAAAGFLQKPFLPKSLVQTLWAAVGSSSTASVAAV